MEKNTKPSASNENTEIDPKMPENFRSIIVDFINDLSLTFPEYSFLWCKWSSPETTDEELNTLFNYFLTVFPERFFDILYQNEEMFLPTSDINTCFLPNVDFKLLFNCDNVSDKTQKIMWKYLQLILFTILGSIKNKNNFGETMSLFDGVDENDLQSKLQETIENMSEFFTNIEMNEKEDAETTAENNGEQSSYPNDTFNFDFENIKNNIPNPEELHEHLKGLFDGKIGKLAKELAEEISQDITGILGDDISNVNSTQDVLKKMMKNPKKMMDLVKTVGNKLNKKMESGEVSQEELMKEASDIFGKMKGMGGNEQFTEIFKNLAKQMNGGKNSKLDLNAMSNMMKLNTTKEKMKEKLNKRRTQMEEQNNEKCTLQQKDENTYVFRMNDEHNLPEKTSIQQKDEIEKIMKDLNINEKDTKTNITNITNITNKGEQQKKKSSKKKK
jgi:hypothetical protein